MAAAGIAETDRAALDGANLLPYLLGRDPDLPPRRLFWRYGGQAAVREGAWKLVRSGGETSWELYDITDDSSESKDLGATQPETRDRLQAAWKAWNAQLAPARW
jgi:arylsulfatase A-like enzyme